MKFLALLIIILVCISHPKKGYCIDDNASLGVDKRKTQSVPVSSNKKEKVLKAIVFDIGNVFVKVDLNPSAWASAFKKIGVNLPEGENILKNGKISATFYEYSEGKISTEKFISKFSEKLGIKSVPINKFKAAWNSVILSLDTDAIKAIEEFRALGYRIYALSDNNQMHTDLIQELYQKIYPGKNFYKLFDKSYLSQQTGYRKASDQAWLHVLKEQQLKPEECLFIDDVEHNVDRAKKLGFHVFHYTPQTNMKTVLSKLPEYNKE